MGFWLGLLYFLRNPPLEKHYQPKTENPKPTTRGVQLVVPKSRAVVGLEENKENLWLGFGLLVIGFGLFSDFVV